MAIGPDISTQSGISSLVKQIYTSGWTRNQGKSSGLTTVDQAVNAHVQDMVGLMVGEVELKQMEPLIDGRIEAEHADQELDGADAAAGDGSDFGRGFVLDVAGGEDRLERGGSDRAIEPASDFALARGVVAVWNRFHSKSPSGIWHETWAGQSNVP